MTEPAPALDALLSVRNAVVAFGGHNAVDDVSFDLRRGETLAIVGESGSGKTALGLAILGLTPEAATVSGEFIFDGSDLAGMNSGDWSRVRGRRIAAVFQDPLTSLNPYLSIGRQMTEMTRLHLGLGREDARRHAIAMLDSVGIPAASKRIDDHPHEFSGGMRQRVAIAMALSCRPDLLIADEPTTALDVTIQAQILDLLGELRRETGISVLLISHDLSLVASRADRVVVMYAGRVMEHASAAAIFTQAANPYTLALLKSLAEPVPGQPLFQIPGMPPSSADAVTGCAFSPRCFRAESICAESRPGLRTVAAGHVSRCHFEEVSL